MIQKYSYYYDKQTSYFYKGYLSPESNQGVSFFSVPS
jgi:hypothetical protein